MATDPPQVVPGHVGYAPDYKSDTKGTTPSRAEVSQLLETLKRKDDPLGVAEDSELQAVLKTLETREMKLLQRVAELARPLLKWDRDKAEARLPGLYDALKDLEERGRT